MFGSNTGILNVFVDDRHGNNKTDYNRSLVWRESGSKGKKWFQGVKTINSQSKFKIVIESVIKKTFYGNIGETKHK